VLRWTPYWDRHRCAFNPQEYRDFEAYRCMCNGETGSQAECQQTEEILDCGNHPYECYNDPP